MQALLLLISNQTKQKSKKASLVWRGAFFISFVALVLTGAMGCQSPKGVTKSSEKVIRSGSKQKVFYYPYESVWRAAQLALRYPISVNNMDNGTLETDWIRANEGFIRPDAKAPPSSGLRYKIALIVAKGRVNGKDATRVTIDKAMEKKRDFFSDPESLETDGLEEKVIFYRMERELVIEEGLKKATEPAK